MSRSNLACVSVKFLLFGSITGTMMKNWEEDSIEQRVQQLKFHYNLKNLIDYGKSRVIY